MNLCQRHNESVKRSNANSAACVNFDLDDARADIVAPSAVNDGKTSTESGSTIATNASTTTLPHGSAVIEPKE